MSFQVGLECQIHPTAKINVKEGFLGDRSILREGVIIEGTHVEIGRESYFDMRARIGGGSCHGKKSKLTAGDWLHMGVDSHINIARQVWIGHEVGIGVETKIFTHGAYLPATDGFPTQWANVTIGNRVWLPHAWVNPGSFIEDNVVVAAGSVVNGELRKGCLYGGIPARIIRDSIYPKKLTFDEKRHIVVSIIEQIDEEITWLIWTAGEKTFGIIVCGSHNAQTYFDIDNRNIIGNVTIQSELVKEQLRRNGIRFRFIANQRTGVYQPWTTSQMS